VQTAQTGAGAQTVARARDSLALGHRLSLGLGTAWH
jgi:hypothetical protein